MRNIAVKRPSLSPTLKWHGFSLAPTWEELVLYVIKLNKEIEALKK
jgi:hypothetical protein